MLCSPVDCPFCTLSRDRISIATEHAVAFSDGYPVAPGHTLVIPRLHLPSLFDVPDVQAAVWQLVAQVRGKLMHDLHPDGFNIGINDGLAAGQTVPHAHVHVIPRWIGDVPDPRGGVRWVIPEKAAYWRER
jgi:diadenosine tetraphosphate (Ap4A) HIT family hydrolase